VSDKKTAPKTAAVQSKGAAAKGAPAAAAKAAPAPKAAPKAKPSSPKAAPAPVAPTAEAEHKHHSFRRKMIGTVTSDKMNKTVVVEVIRKAMDPVYKKYVRMRDKYKAHDEQNTYKVGDRVEITEHRPISRDKRWLVTRLLSRRVEA
jgi:small subunit ribosomal protein S17